MTHRGEDFLLVHHVLVARIGVRRQPLELAHELLLLMRIAGAHGEAGASEERCVRCRVDGILGRRKKTTKHPAIEVRCVTRRRPREFTLSSSCADATQTEKARMATRMTPEFFIVLLELDPTEWLFPASGVAT